jgi:hypothetical protein
MGVTNLGAGLFFLLISWAANERFVVDEVIILPNKNRRMEKTLATKGR